MKVLYTVLSLIIGLTFMTSTKAQAREASGNDTVNAVGLAASNNTSSLTEEDCKKIHGAYDSIFELRGQFGCVISTQHEKPNVFCPVLNLIGHYLWGLAIECNNAGFPDKK